MKKKKTEQSLFFLLIFIIMKKVICEYAYQNGEGSLNLVLQISQRNRQYSSISDLKKRIKKSVESHIFFCLELLIHPE